LRWLLHVISEKHENAVLDWSARALRDGLLMIEARSDKGRLPDDTHYRRLISPEQLKEKLLRLGFSIAYDEELDEFSPFGDDRPILFRLVGRHET
jgi:hypothetical protein